MLLVYLLISCCKREPFAQCCCENWRRDNDIFQLHCRSAPNWISSPNGYSSCRQRNLRRPTVPDVEHQQIRRSAPSARRSCRITYYTANMISNTTAGCVENKSQVRKLPHFIQEGLAVASIARDDPSPLPPEISASSHPTIRVRRCQ